MGLGRGVAGQAKGRDRHAGLLYVQRPLNHSQYAKGANKAVDGLDEAGHWPMQAGSGSGKLQGTRISFPAQLQIHMDCKY